MVSAIEAQVSTGATKGPSETAGLASALLFIIIVLVALFSSWADSVECRHGRHSRYGGACGRGARSRCSGAQSGAHVSFEWSSISTIAGCELRPQARRPNFGTRPRIAGFDLLVRPSRMQSASSPGHILSEFQL